MNRYEQIMACSQIREFVQKKQYRNALSLMDGIDLSRFRSRIDQLDFVEVYLHTMRYEDARELLLPLYDDYPTCHVIHDLFFVSMKLHELEDARDFLIDYQERAPHDPERLIMEYMLARDKGLPRHELIIILKKLKQEEYSDVWGYELAKLYHKEGRKEECIRECNDLIAWFGKGRIVNKAITLKQLYLGTATIPLDEIQEAIKDKEEEADKMVEEVTRVCRNLYQDVSVGELLEEQKKKEAESLTEKKAEQQETAGKNPEQKKQKQEALGQQMEEVEKKHKEPEKENKKGLRQRDFGTQDSQRESFEKENFKKESSGQKSPEKESTEKENEKDTF